MRQIASESRSSERLMLSSTAPDSDVPHRNSTVPAPHSCSTSATSRSDGRTRWATSARTRSGVCGPLHVELQETRRSPRWRDEQLRERFEASAGRASAPPGESPLRASSAPSAPRSAAARSPRAAPTRRLFRTCRGPAASRRPRSASRACRRSRETPRLRRSPATSSSMKTAMRSPFLVLSGRRPETMPPTQTSASDAVSSATRCAPNVFSSSAEALERMAAHVEAERFLLERELLALGPGRRVGQRHRHRPGRRRSESPNSCYCPLSRSR